MLLALVHAAATCYLAGLSWVVQLVVYPSFALVGPTPQWPAFHAAHARRITTVVGPAWAVQGAAVVALLARRDDLTLVVPAALLAALTVVLTVVGAVPAHDRLTTYDETTLTALRRVHAWRTAAWSLGAVLSIAVAAQSG